MRFVCETVDAAAPPVTVNVRQYDAEAAATPPLEAVSVPWMSCERRFVADTPPVIAPVSAITVPAPAVVPVRIRNRIAVPLVPTVNDASPLRYTPVITGVSVGIPETEQTTVSAFAAGDPTIVLEDAKRGEKSIPLPLREMLSDATRRPYCVSVGCVAAF